MVEVILPREVKGSELLKLLEESARELGYDTKRRVEEYRIVPGSVKEEPVKETLDIKVWWKRRSNNLWGRLKKRVDNSLTEYNYYGIVVDSGCSYRTANISVKNGVASVSIGNPFWKEVKPEFDKLIDKLYNKLGYSTKTQADINQT